MLLKKAKLILYIFSDLKTQLLVILPKQAKSLYLWLLWIE